MIDHRRTTPQGRERGSSLITAILLVTVCVAISASVVMPSLSRHSAAEQAIARDSALAVAESGLDWGLAVVRRQGGRIDADFEEVHPIAGAGTATISYVRGDGNGADDDGDGTTDEAEEARYTDVRSVGQVGATRRGVRTVVMGPAPGPTPEAAILLNVPTPVTAIRGNAFTIDGRDHDADGNPVAGAASVPALGTGGSPADLIAQLPAMLHDQIIGAGGSPSVAQRPLTDMDVLVNAATQNGYAELAPGTYPGQQLGIASPEGVTPVTVVNGNLHLAGTSGGSGTLVVNGDLHLSGDFTWEGTILVRGNLQLTGGGKSKRLVGAVVVGDGITGDALSAGDIASMSTGDLGEVDAEIQAAYDQMVAADDAMVWDPAAGEYIGVKWTCTDPNHAHYPGNLAPTQVTETIEVEETVWVPDATLVWLNDPTAEGGGYWVEQGQTHWVEIDSDAAELAGMAEFQTRSAATEWVAVPGTWGDGYWAVTTTGTWNTQKVMHTVLVQDVDPVLHLSGTVDILFSSELAEAAGTASGPSMDVMVWVEFDAE